MQAVPGCRPPGGRCARSGARGPANQAMRRFIAARSLPQSTPSTSASRPRMGRVRHHLLEYEPSPQRGIQQGDGSVCGIHRPQDVQIRRYAKIRLRAGQRHPCLVVLTDPLGVFDQGDQFTEDSGNVAAIDFIDHKHVAPVRVRRGALRDTPEYATGQLIPDSLRHLRVRAGSSCCLPGRAGYLQQSLRRWCSGETSPSRPARHLDIRRTGP